ncbi:hypothetical protein [Desulfofustis phage LS06-2018-MD01]|nr:hypothetical protein [Desulfofustis phage LS06-2018-MD01]
MKILEILCERQPHHEPNLLPPFARNCLAE